MALELQAQGNENFRIHLKKNYQFTSLSDFFMPSRKTNLVHVTLNDTKLPLVV